MSRRAGINRKELIKQAAIELFAERGFSATPTAEVARRAGVSEGSIFYHFHTKDGILISLMEEIMDEFVGNLRQATAAAPNGLEALLACLRMQNSFADERQKEVRILIRDMPASFGDEDCPYHERVLTAHHRLVDVLRHAINMGQRDGSIRSGEPRILTRLVMALLIGCNRLSLMDQEPAAQSSDAMAEFCRHALAASPERPAHNLSPLER